MTGSTIPGVRYLRLVRHDDARGSFREIWRASTFAGVARDLGRAGQTPSSQQDDTGQTLQFVQANLSTSERGVLRGLHCHQRQLDYWVVGEGRAFVALVDIRPLISGAGEQAIVETRTLGADDAVVVPAGVGHGFLALERLELLYLVTNEYDGRDELGFSWDDPALAISWPLDTLGLMAPLISNRDRSSPSLNNLLDGLRQPPEG